MVVRNLIDLRTLLSVLAVLTYECLVWMRCGFRHGLTQGE